MDRNKALEIIEKAKTANSVFLNFTNMGITDEDLRHLLPEIIEKLPNLESLFLGYNQLTSIPREIGNLKKLKDLFLEHNQLTSIPGEIGNLGNLEILKLSNNQLTSIPGEIGNLENLKTLDLSYNQLASIPAEIGDLENLETLDLSYNQLASIPGEIGNLENLKTLNLSYNQLTSILGDIGNLENLKYLFLSHNQLTSNNVPDRIENLVNLEILDVSNNQFTSVPEVFGNLNIRSLNISHNRVTNLPETLNIYNDSRNRIVLYDNPLTTETMDWINASVDLSHMISFDMTAHETIGNHTDLLDRIYGNTSNEKQGLLGNLKGEYQIENGNKTGADVVKDFLEKAASNSLPATILDVVIKHYVDKALSEDEITKDTALTEMATALGNCATPVRSLILNKAIGLAQEDATLFKDQAQLEAMLERMALEDYLTKHFEPLKDPKLNEYIEKLNGLLNTVYLKDVEKRPDNKIQISGERTRLAPISANIYFALSQIHTDWVELFAKICCQTDEHGMLKKDGNQKYILDPHKLKVIKQQFMNDNNLGDSNIRVVLADFNKKCEEELNKYTELVANMSSLSEKYQKMLTPDTDKLTEQLVNKKDGETNKKIVENCFKTYSDNIEKVLQSKSYKKYILNNMLEDKKERINEINTSNPITEGKQQTQVIENIEMSNLNIEITQQAQAIVNNKKDFETDSKTALDEQKEEPINSHTGFVEKNKTHNIETSNTDNTQQSQAIEDKDPETDSKKALDKIFLAGGGLVYKYNEAGYKLVDPDLEYAKVFFMTRPRQSRLAKFCDVLHCVPILGFLSPVIRTLFLESGNVSKGRFAKELVIGVVPFGGIIYRFNKLYHLPKRDSEIYQLVLQKTQTEIALDQKLKAASVIGKLLKNKSDLEDGLDDGMASEMNNIHRLVDAYRKNSNIGDVEDELVESTIFIEEYIDVYADLLEGLRKPEDKTKVDEILEEVIDVNSIEKLISIVADKTDSASRMHYKKLNDLKSQLAWAKCIDYVNSDIGEHETKFESTCLSKDNITKMIAWLENKNVDYKGDISKHLKRYLDFSDTKTEVINRGAELEELKKQEWRSAWYTYQSLTKLDAYTYTDKNGSEQRKAIEFKEDIGNKYKMGIEKYETNIALLVPSSKKKDDMVLKENIQLLKDINEWVLRERINQINPDSYEAVLRPCGYIKNNKDEQTIYLQQVNKKYAKKYVPKPPKRTDEPKNKPKDLQDLSQPCIRRNGASSAQNPVIPQLQNPNNSRIRV